MTAHIPKLAHAECVDQSDRKQCLAINTFQKRQKSTPAALIFLTYRPSTSAFQQLRHTFAGEYKRRKASARALSKPFRQLGPQRNTEEEGNLRSLTLHLLSNKCYSGQRGQAKGHVVTETRPAALRQFLVPLPLSAIRWQPKHGDHRVFCSPQRRHSGPIWHPGPRRDRK